MKLRSPSSRLSRAKPSCRANRDHAVRFRIGVHEHKPQNRFAAVLGGDAQDHAVAGHALRPLVILLVGPARTAEHENAEFRFDDHFEVVNVVDAAAHRARSRKALLDRLGILRRAVSQQ